MLIDCEIEEPVQDCSECSHFLGGGSCQAFDKIPIDLYLDASAHTEKRADQKGDFVFEPNKPISTKRVYKSTD